ncbi:MAG: hypothetical protein BroJett025_06030 [Patescibacteria group bacterium]|nr:MAG: hypothetical protein BroJett025_06030 [Patescibacteria group bacterium]
MQQSYSVGTIQKILEEARLSTDETLFIQSLLVRSDDNNEYTVTLGDEYQPITQRQLREVGDQVILYSSESQPGEISTVIADLYRMPTIIWLSILFVVIVIGVGKRKGVLSILGMIASLLVLLKFIIPQILLGANPILISLFGSLLIGSATVYLSHGYNLKSHIALFSMMTSLAFVSVISYLAVVSASMFGLGSEEAAFLQVGNTANINLQGLLLGGIMLGALGVLDDVTVSQVSIVFQLRAAKKTIKFQELYNRALEVGRDHVASLVNTLVLAYAGANMPLFLLFTINESVPTWVTLNSEVIVEEVIRTLTGSMGLVLAVPLTTLIATTFAMKLKKDEVEVMGSIEPMEHKGHTH